MKWFLLVAIFAVAQHQGVTGFPRDVPGVSDHVEKDCEETYTLEDIKTKLEDLTKSRPNSLRNAHATGFGPIDKQFAAFNIPILSKAVDDISNVFGRIKSSYEQKILSLENIVKSKYEHLKDLVTKDQSGLENVASSNKTQVNTPQTASTLDESEVNQQSHISGRSLDIPLVASIQSYLSDKIDYIKLSYQQIKEMTHFQNTIDNIKYYINVLKNKLNKNTKDQSTLENIASDDKTQENATQTTSILDELVNQQPTLGENDNKKEESEADKEIEEDKDQLTLENTVSGDKTQVDETQTASTLDESVVNQQPTPGENDNKKEESEADEEIRGKFLRETKNQLTPKNTVSGDKTQVNKIQTASTLDESVVNQQPKIVRVPLYRRWKHRPPLRRQWRHRRYMEA
ncbi:uncharacterized protein LOC143895274 [Temnothorax americanus]|uniref:uncharacterized protein LOC143895274 n=1 Tax=Temnothorax americanus TaxID=1964332 RepID=UPI00406988B6